MDGLIDRDPRIDPKKGDVLTKVQGRIVTKVQESRVWYHYERFLEYSMTLNAWRKWAATARVVRKAGE